MFDLYWALARPFLRWWRKGTYDVFVHGHEGEPSVFRRIPAGSPYEALKSLPAMGGKQDVWDPFGKVSHFEDGCFVGEGDGVTFTPMPPLRMLEGGQQ